MSTCLCLSSHRVQLLLRSPCLAGLRALGGGGGGGGAAQRHALQLGPRHLHRGLLRPVHGLQRGKPDRAQHPAQEVQEEQVQGQPAAHKPGKDIIKLLMEISFSKRKKLLKLCLAFGHIEPHEKLSMQTAPGRQHTTHKSSDEQ